MKKELPAPMPARPTWHFGRKAQTAVLLTLGLAAVLAWLAHGALRYDSALGERVPEQLRTLKAIDAEWNADLVRSRNSLSTKTRAMADPEPIIKQLEAHLAGTMPEPGTAMADANDRIMATITDYRAIIAQKSDQTRKLHAQIASLHDSTRFIAGSAWRLTEELDRLPALGPVLKAEVRDRLTRLIAQSMSYVVTSSPEHKEAIGFETERIRKLAPAVSKSFNNSANNMLGHVQNAVEQQDEGDFLLRRIGALDVARRIDAITEAFAVRAELAQQRQQNYAIATLAYASVLLLALMWLGWRLMRSYRLLRRTNQMLAHANHELKESQAQLVQSEKMSALGQMVAGIAHEINTPLAYLSGNLSLLGERLVSMKQLALQSLELTRLMRQDRSAELITAQMVRVEELAAPAGDTQAAEKLDRLLASGMHGVGQITEIVTNLKNFSRLDRAKVAQFDVREGLRSTLVLARNTLKSRVMVLEEFEDVPSILCSPSQINQVFLNIITNAVQAIPDDRPGLLRLSTTTEPDGRVCVEIQDNGSGIPASALPNIFDPFFTTKPVGMGTGLGLSISYKIIREHGGTIEVDTEPDIGTVFRILLPAQPPHSEHLQSSEVLDDDVVPV